MGMYNPRWCCDSFDADADDYHEIRKADPGTVPCKTRLIWEERLEHCILEIDCMLDITSCMSQIKVIHLSIHF